MKKDIRDIFFDNIKNTFLRKKNIFILTNDADIYSLQKIKKNKRFIDAGVAEQNLINIAAGLASQKKLPLIYGFCTFLTFRCYEQLKFNIGSHNLNCKIIGIGPGYSFSNDGPTHHGIQDLYLMYLIPEFEIYNISDNNLANLISKKLFTMNGPVYVRLDKGILDYNNDIQYDIKKGYALTISVKGNKKLIITTGIFNKIANELALKNKIDVLNLFRIKNFNKKGFLNLCKKYDKIIIYDESTMHGGITPIIQNLFLHHNLKKDITYLCSPDRQVFKYAQTREKILEILKISKQHLSKII